MDNLLLKVLAHATRALKVASVSSTVILLRIKLAVTADFEMELRNSEGKKPYSQYIANTLAILKAFCKYVFNVAGVFYVLLEVFFSYVW